jgi:SAM-dependent methyltransferase
VPAERRNTGDAGVDYDAAAADYDRTRGRSVAIGAWREPVLRALSTLPPGPVLDLGAGTGLWSPTLASWTGRPVVAVEPSAGMRAQARRTGRLPHVHQVGGVGGALPLRAGSVAAAWLSTVIHHVGDIARCAGELRRTLSVGAPVLIRSGFAGRLDGIGLFRFFPAARRVGDRFPTVESVTATFEAAGFAAEGLARVEELPTLDLRGWRDQLPTERRADTVLVGLTDAEFAAGMHLLDRAISAGESSPPIGIDLLWFR